MAGDINLDDGRLEERTLGDALRAVVMILRNILAMRCDVGG